MSFPFVRVLFEMKPQWATPAEFAVLVTLANYADRNGVAYPSKPTIARRVGLKPRQVWNVTRALESRGLVTIDRGAGPRGCDLFTLTLDRAEEVMTPATHCRGDTTPSPATDCQESIRPSADPGNPSISTPAIVGDDPGNEAPRPRQPVATDPKDPRESQVRNPPGSYQLNENEDLALRRAHLDRVASAIGVSRWTRAAGGSHSE